MGVDAQTILAASTSVLRLCIRGFARFIPGYRAFSF